jgi:hypothetical protein
VFAKLIARERSAPAAPPIFIVVGVDGSVHQFCERDVRVFPLYASDGEAAWRCSSCRADGWSLDRACVCVACGAPSPEDETRMTELKQQKRELMALRRPRHLQKRRIVAGTQPLRTQPRSAGS